MLPQLLDPIREKIAAGRRLSAADGELLFGGQLNLHEVGQLADLVRRRKNGELAYYNLNAHLNPTNVCVYRCPLCAYSRDAGDPQAYTMTNDEILARGQEAADAGCTELHIVGGAHPQQGFDWYLDMIRRLHAAYPRLHLKAFTAVEIAWFAELAGRPMRAILEELIAAGLGSLPGGGAEIFDPEIRARICPRKADARTWLEVHRTAHQLGLRSNASMLYGHVETAAQRVDHLLQLRQLQDETGGFQVFIPLAFHPAHTALAEQRGRGSFAAAERDQQPALGRCPSMPGPAQQSPVSFFPSALLDLRVMAVSRLLLDNFDHVKAYWISLGVGTAQVALAYGADDLDGTVRHERIHHDAGAQSPEVLTVDALRRLIGETGRQPVERDSLYRRVRRNGTRWEVAG